MASELDKLIGAEFPAAAAVIAGEGTAGSPASRGRGRPKGSANVLTRTVREGLAAVYEHLGGDEGFAAWANNHKTEFYKMLVRTTPKESELGVRGSGITVVVGTVRDIERDRRGRVIDVTPRLEHDVIDVEPE